MRPLWRKSRPMTANDRVHAAGACDIDFKSDVAAPHACNARLFLAFGQVVDRAGPITEVGAFYR